jgi:hypothetical protein
MFIVFDHPNPASSGRSEMWTRSYVAPDGAWFIARTVSYRRPANSAVGRRRLTR